MPKRKCTFKDEYLKNKGIKRSKKGDEWFYCELCSCNINLCKGGQSTINEHLNSKKHRTNSKATQSTASILSFMPSLLVPTLIDDKTAAAEGAWAYHTTVHHQSFASTNCISSDGLFRTMFANSNVAAKFSPAETKTAAIIKGVLAPYSHQQLLKELSSLPYSISIDASNHKETKLFPVVSPNDGIKVRLLELKDLLGESSGIVVQFITNV